MDIKKTLDKMTLRQKAKLVSGKNYWQTVGFPKLGIPSVMMTDGPHGLRKEAPGAKGVGITQSVSATCFPPACASACTWDRGLVRRMGEAIAEEAAANGVSAVLGPGVNIKRSPLCGRNFEYLSEDPYISGVLASAYIEGMQSAGVGACIKHYCANNQESWRMISDSRVDERTLREIYLSAFETAIKRSRPSMVMCSYNRLNGVYLSDSKRLLSEVLRGEWGFDGVVVTDWGACNDRVAGIRAGLDLEMPSSSGINARRIVKAVKSGELGEKELDAAAARLLKFIAKRAVGGQKRYSREEHRELARQIARNGCVLLKRGSLPLPKSARVALIGEFAKHPRFQGAGSSFINPEHLSTACDALSDIGVEYVYAGFGEPDKALEAARNADAALVFAGLPAVLESESFDRVTLDLPLGQNALISQIAAINPKTVAVLSVGAPVLLPWENEVDAILCCYLGGQEGAAAAADILFGDENPSGKLCETWPLRLEDTPCFKTFAAGRESAVYEEGVFVGYRHYATRGVSVRYPFGYGLSYTRFEYSNLSIVKKAGYEYTVSVDITNAGERQGVETVQLYIGMSESAIERPKMELKGFERVELRPGETGRAVFELDFRSFAYYNAALGRFSVEGGVYTVMAGASSEDIRVRGVLYLAGDAAPSDEKVWITEDITYGADGLCAALGDIKASAVGKLIYWIAVKMSGVGDKNDPNSLMMSAMLDEMPLRSLFNMAGIYIPLCVQRWAAKLAAPRQKKKP